MDSVTANPESPSAGPSTQPGPSAALRRPVARSRTAGHPKQSSRAGYLPDGRELFLRKPRSRRTWEPVTNHTCESCGGMYPRIPFDWEEMSSAPDGKRFCALRKRCQPCAFPGLTQTIRTNTLRTAEKFVQQLHPDFQAPASLFVKDSPETVRAFTSGTEATSTSAETPAGSNVPIIPRSRPVQTELNLQPASTTQPFPKSSSVHQSTTGPSSIDKHLPTATPQPSSSIPRNPLLGRQGQYTYKPPPSVASPNTSGQDHSMKPSSVPQQPTPSRQPKYMYKPPALPVVAPSQNRQDSSITPVQTNGSGLPQMGFFPVNPQKLRLPLNPTPQPPSFSLPAATTSPMVSGMDQRASQAGPIRTKPTNPSAAVTPLGRPSSSQAGSTRIEPATPIAPAPSASRPSAPPKQTSSQAKDMLDALKRAFKRDPNPSAAVMELLAATFNISDERVIPQLFESWRRSGNQIRTETSKGAGAAPAGSGRRDFEAGSMDVNGQRTPDLAFSPERQQQRNEESVVETEQNGLFGRILELTGNSTTEQEDGIVASKGENGTTTASAMLQPGETVEKPQQFEMDQTPAVLESNGLLSGLDDSSAMQIDDSPVPAEHIAVNGPSRDEGQISSRGNEAESDQARPVDTGDFRVIIPGMESSPMVQDHLALATPEPTHVDSGARHEDSARPIRSDKVPEKAIESALMSAPAGPVSQTIVPDTVPPAETIDSQRTVAPLPARAAPGPQATPRPAAPPVILDIKPHEVKHFSDPPMQLTYEIFTSPEPHRVGNWLKATFRPASEKYSVLQKDIYTEYKTLFEGSPAACWNGSQVVRLLREIFPETALGRRLDDPSQYRIWGLYRIKIFNGSPWDVLYSGKLREGLDMGTVTPMEPFASESNVSRIGAALDSLASALSVARLDQTKMRDISERSNKKDVEDFKRRMTWHLPREMTNPVPKHETRLVSHLKPNQRREMVPFELVRKEKRPRPFIKREIERVQRELDRDKPAAMVLSAAQNVQGDGSVYRPLVLEDPGQSGQASGYSSLTPGRSQPSMVQQGQSSRVPYLPAGLGSLPAAAPRQQNGLNHLPVQGSSSSLRYDAPTYQQQPQVPPRSRSPGIQSRWYQDAYQPPSHVPNSFLLPKGKQGNPPSPSRPQQQILPRQYQPRQPQGFYDPYDPIYANPPPFPQPGE